MLKEVEEVLIASNVYASHECFNLDFFVFENVVGLKSKKHKRYFRKIVKALEDAGFTLFEQELDAGDFFCGQRCGQLGQGRIQHGQRGGSTDVERRLFNDFGNKIQIGFDLRGNGLEQLMLIGLGHDILTQTQHHILGMRHRLDALGPGCLHLFDHGEDAVCKTYQQAPGGSYRSYS